MKFTDKIYVTSTRGMVGSELYNELRLLGFTNIISSELDLRNQNEVKEFFEREKPDYVFITSAKVGGIIANSKHKAEFYYDNTMIDTNVIHNSHIYGVKKLLYLGSSCIYPKLAKQPIKEEYLMLGPLEETNDAYAMAKISGIKMCQSYREQYESNFISAMPTNLYGNLKDNYDLETSHVLPGMIRKFHIGRKFNKPVELWGSGTPLREFLHVNDLVKALIFLMLNYNESEHINIGSNDEVSIAELSRIVACATGYDKEVIWNPDKPDGTPRKALDSSKLLNMGWKPKIGLRSGILNLYNKLITKHELFIDFEVRDRLSHLKSIEEKIIYLFPFEVCHVDIIKWFLKYDMSIEEFEEAYKTIITNTNIPVEIIEKLNKLLTI